jgi:hypothetical protein
MIPMNTPYTLKAWGIGLLWSLCISPSVHAWETPASSPPQIIRPPVEMAAWAIEQARYTGEVEGEVARFVANLTLRVLQDGLQEIPLTFDNATITDLRVHGGSATLVVRNDRYALSVQRRGKVILTAQLATRLTRDTQQEGIFFGFPQAVFSHLTLAIPRTEVELAPEHLLTVSKKSEGGKVVLTATLGLSRQVTLRWAARPIRTAPVEPSYTAEVRVLATLEEEVLRTMGLVELHILQGQLKSLEFDLPKGLTVVAVRGVPLEEWKASDVAGAQRVSVNLSEPLRIGTARLIVEAEQPLPQPNSPMLLPTVVPIGAKTLTGYMALATGTSMEMRDLSSEGLSRIDVREIPADLVRLSTVPVVAAFRYQKAPYRITATLHRPEELAVLVAIVESADLATLVTSGGERIVRAIYQIRNNKKPSLEMTLPKQATLWSVLVNHRAVKPAAGPEGKVLIPLAASMGPEETFPVEVVYVEEESPFQWLGQTRFQGPVVDIPITVARWHLFLPDKVRGYWFTGNLERHLKVTGSLQDPQLPSPSDLSNLESSSGEGSKGVGGGWGVQGKGRISSSTATVDALEQQEEQTREDSPHRNEEKLARKEGVVRSIRDAQGAPNAPTATPTQKREWEGDDFKAVIANVRQTGVLPFRIAIPRSGRAYHFGRLLTTHEPLTLQVRYLKSPVVPWAVGSLGVFGLAGIGAGLRNALRRRRATPPSVGPPQDKDLESGPPS